MSNCSKNVNSWTVVVSSHRISQSTREFVEANEILGSFDKKRLAMTLQFTFHSNIYKAAIHYYCLL